eukprot:1144803-Pelagomonas_calceolata.AAC.3
MFKVPDWRIWAYVDGSSHIQNGKQKFGAGFYCPLTDSGLSDSKNFVEEEFKPNGTRIINTICRAKLTAIPVAITHSYSHIA